MCDTESEFVLESQGLCKTFGRGQAAVPAVRDVDLKLHKGEFVAIVGASGSGKTTLLNLLSGLEHPDAGMITIAGSEVTAASDARMTKTRLQHVGVVFQAFNLMPTLSAQDNVAIPLLLAGTGRGAAREKALQRLKEVGLTDRATNKPAQLSGGEQQRVALARAMINDPLVIFADEPTGSLDLENSRSVTKLLRETVASKDRAVVMVTHDPIVAAKADRIIVMSDGRIADQFPTREVESTVALSTRILNVAEQPHPR